MGSGDQVVFDVDVLQEPSWISTYEEFPEATISQDYKELEFQITLGIRNIRGYFKHIGE